MESENKRRRERREEGRWEERRRAGGREGMHVEGEKSKEGIRREKIDEEKIEETGEVVNKAYECTEGAEGRESTYGSRLN